MPDYLTPGVYFETSDVARRGITAIRTDIAAFVGIAERGPLHTPTRVSSWAQFQAAFGGFIPSGYLAYVVKAFFENSGQTCYIVRIAARSAAAASGELLDEAGQPTLRIEASSPGAWGNSLLVRMARSSPAATYTIDMPQPADRSASLVESVVGFPVDTLARIFQAQQSGPLLSHRVVAAVEPGRKCLSWKAPLDLAYNLSQPLSFEAVMFGLTVYLEGRICEIYSSLSLVPQHDRYVVRVVNELEPSAFIRVTDLGSPAPFPYRLLDPRAASRPPGVLRLRAGRDGITAIEPEDFTGEPGAETKRGLRTLEDLDEVAIVAVPDILVQPAPPVETAPLPEPDPDPCLPGDPPARSAEPLAIRSIEQPRRFSSEQVFLVQQALVEHCETQRDRIALLDPPALSGRVDLADPGAIQGWRQRFDSKYAALYYPWVLVYDPLRLGGQVVRAIPPSGHVAGVFARVDVETGVHAAPANQELRWAQGTAADVTAELQGLLNPLGINCIRTFPGRGLRVYGARTLSSDAEWRFVNVRRLLMMIEEAVEISLQWAVFEPNNIYLRQTVILAISSFLEALWERGALAGATATEAFFVKCDEENNPPSATEVGQLVAEVGVAPVMPAEFVVFRIGRAEDELEIAE